MREGPAALAERLRPVARVFAELGYDHARIEDITEATGVASSTLYYYFEGKLGVLAFVLRHLLDGIAAAVQTDVSAAGPAHARLARVVRTQLRMMADQPDTYRVLLAELGQLGRLPDIAKSVNEAILDPVRDLLEQGARDGSLRDLPAETAAAAVFGAATFAGLYYLIDDRPIDGTADTVLALLSEGFRS
jgi:AcrR family transcriptional regulator